MGGMFLGFLGKERRRSSHGVFPDQASGDSRPHGFTTICDGFPQRVGTKWGTRASGGGAHW